MKRISLLIGLVVCYLSSVASAAAYDATWPYKFGNIDYTVETAPYVTVKQTKGYDFDIYQFTLNGRIFLYAYVGNNPSLPLMSPNEKCSKNRHPLNGLRADTIICRASGGAE